MLELPDRFDGLPNRELGGGLVLVEAATMRSRMRGLARLDPIPRHAALHIPRCASVHTIGMRFPLDLLWLDREGALLRLDEDVPPRRHRSKRKARSVIETRAGEGRAFARALALDLPAPDDRGQRPGP